jgi:acetoacetyl-CoA synthetase
MHLTGKFSQLLRKSKCGGARYVAQKLSAKSANTDISRVKPKSSVLSSYEAFKYSFDISFVIFVNSFSSSLLIPSRLHSIPRETMTSSPRPLWTPSNPESTEISKYRNHINKKFNVSLQNSQDLQRWSVAAPSRHDFWIDLWSYVGMIPSLPSGIKEVYPRDATIQDNPRWFEGVLINYAENVLEGRNLDGIALIGIREGERLDGDVWTWRKLRENVRRARSALQRIGVKKGDRVAVLMSNSNWTIALFLATVTFGAVYTSISPDMGLEGVVSRLLQVKPKVLLADSSQTYKGRKVSMKEKISQIVETMKEEPPKVYVVPLVPGESHNFPVLDDLLANASPTDKLEYERMPFSQEMIILYSSGTTGPPKCIVHQHGIIIQLKKIAVLHNGLSAKDIVFQYSSTSWVLWNIMNGHLSVGATVICYDGMFRKCAPRWLS